MCASGEQMGEFEAIGEAVTGGAVARAVEPTTGEAGDGHTHEKNCLNCGCALVGDFCHCCGQQAHVHRTLGAWWHDFLHSVLHLDGKFVRTMPMLALHPGELTRRYVTGERAKFISPLALFLFSVFLMFAVFSVLGSPTGLGDINSTPGEERAEAEREIRAERAEAREELAALERELRDARAAGEPTGAIEGEMTGVKQALAAQERAYRLALRLADEQERRERQQAARDATQEPNGAVVPKPPSNEVKREPEINLLTETGWAPLDQAIAKAEGNPSLLFYKIQANAYKFSWALIPISLPFVWLLFLHRRRYRQEYGAYDHLIFVTYSIAFMSLGAVALALLGAVGVSSALTGLAITFVPPIHMYRQLRGAYQLSRWSAAWRTFVLIVSSFVALSLFFLLLVVAGVFA